METHNDNQRKLWFRAKRFGWGWYPVAWQGWLSILIFVGIIFIEVQRADSAAHSASDALIGISLPIVLATALLILLCYGTGEKPGWRWGLKDEDTDKE